ncbi:unnamed protein product [Mortierella alpina]
MGITKFGEFRKRQKLEGTSITSEDVSQYHTHVDFGCYFHRARQKLVAFDYTAARKSMKAPQEAATILHTTPTFGLTAANQARDNAGSDIAHMVDYDLRRLGFEPATTTIHLDGSRTIEKAKARQERNKVAREKRREAMKLLEQCEERAADGVASRTKAFYRLLHDIRYMSSEERDSTQCGLQQLGWSAHICAGEADVCIARHIRDHTSPSSTAGRHQEALQMDEDELQLLAVVSTSDYAKSVPHYGLVRNHKVIKGLQVDPGPDRLRRMLEKYCATVGRANFDHSWSVFVARIEHPAQDPLPYPASISQEQSHAALIARMWQARNLYHASRPRTTSEARRRRRRKRYRIQSVSWQDTVFDPPTAPQQRKRRRKAKKHQKRAVRPRISSRTARSQKYSIQASVPRPEGSSQQQQAAIPAHDRSLDSSRDSQGSSQEEGPCPAPKLTSDQTDGPSETGDSQDEFWGDLSDDAVTELLNSLEAANAMSNTNAVLNDTPSKPKRKQTDWQNLECHCDMVTAELGSLEYLLKRNLGPRIRDRSEQHVARVQNTLMELSATCQRHVRSLSFPKDERTTRALAKLAKKEIDTAKRQYNQAIKELEMFGSIEPSAKSNMEQAHTQYYYQLVMHIESGYSEIKDELALAQGRLQMAVKQLRDGQMTNVVDATVQYLQGVVRDMSDRYQWTHRALCLFVAATIWGPATESAEEKQERDEDLRALLDPRRSLSIAFWTGKFLVGDVMDTTSQPRNTMIDRSRVVRIAQTAAQMLRECCPGRHLSPVPAGQSAIMLQVSGTLSNKFAEFFTTSLSALQTEVLTSSSSPVRCTMIKIFSTTEDMVFSLFYEQTRYVKSTMPMQDFAEDKGGVKLYLQQKWRDAKGRMYEPRTQRQRRWYKRNVSSGSITTNGLVVHGLMFDTTRRKTLKRAAKKGCNSPLVHVPYLGDDLPLAPAIQTHLQKHRDRMHVSGLGLGEVFPCAATTLPPDPAINQAENILISRRSVYDGTEALQRKLAIRKAAPITRENEPGVQYPSINELEALAPARGASGVQPLQDYIKWYREYEELLGSLYRSTWWKRLSWENSKAQMAESGRMFDAIVRSTGMTRSAALTIDEETGYCENLVLVVGDGDFCSGRGKPSMHNSMLRRLILQARGHGILVFQVHEEYTSSRCPRSHHEVIKYSRSVECRSCHIFHICLHRDSAGAHNVAFIGREHVHGRPRPEGFPRLH